jgi:uncharacterized repeat protein (TIGR03803 family)
MDALGTVTTLYSFSTNNASPTGLTRAIDGHFYGTTVGGGFGHGTIFKIDASGTLTTLYRFSSIPDGSSPYGGLVQATDGNFYGTTALGRCIRMGNRFQNGRLGDIDDAV